MLGSSENRGLEMLCVIVNHGLGSGVLKFSKHHGVTGGTILLGKGTVKSPILEFLDIAETRKEIVLMAAESDTAHKVLEELDKKYHFEKPHHGIAISTPIIGVLGTNSCVCKIEEEVRGERKPMYNSIIAIVDKGKAEEVIEAAKKAGSRGGTIINARGSGIHETNKLFAMEIEPEKEVVLIISEQHLTDAITCSIKEHLKMDEAGNGIIFVQEVNKAYGLF